jgi:hypothetical protein
MSDLTEARIALEHIERTLRFRWWIFGVIAIALAANGLTTCLNSDSISRIEQRGIVSDARSLENKATIDAAIKQQVIYQQQLVQYWDALAKKNPKVNVPRVTVRPPSPAPVVRPQNEVTVTASPLSDAELTRSPSAKPAPTPRHSKPTHKHKSTPTATPKPWYNFFKATR